jgi:regulator of sigma E protease
VAIPRAFAETGQMLVALKREVSSWIAGKRAPQLVGPVGLVQLTGEFTQKGGLSGWLLLTILFSVNLAIFNILPIPMLDGGRLVFVVLEWLRRGKRVPPEKEGLVHLIGLVVLIAAILLITANDINRLIQGGSPLGG